jgi:three-Cys-motif partner protein
MEPVSDEPRYAQAARIAGGRMSDFEFQLDEIGYWSELKLEIIEKYGQAYTNAFNKLGAHLKKYYIDGFSGAGVHLSRRTGEHVEGSPARALKIMPPFDRFYFIDMNADKTAYLEKVRASRTNVEIHTGDTNPYLKRLLPTIKYGDYKRALCLLDPYGLHLDWEVMQIAGQLKTVDMFLNFPIMDINRNVLRRDRTKVAPDDIKRMNRFWGDDSWDSAAFVETGQTSMFDFGPEKAKQGNDAIVAAFRDRLRKVAGFKCVPAPLAMTNKNNAVVYYLFFASDNDTGLKIIESIFAKYRQQRH